MSLLDRFPFGDLVRVTATFTDTNDIPFDPEFVRFECLLPNGETKIQATYGSDENVLRVEAGTYAFDLNCDTAGLYVYRFEASGDGQAAQRGMFRVDPEFLPI